LAILGQKSLDLLKIQSVQAILGQKSLDRIKIQSRSKITPHFCHKETMGKTE
jgi:hypothetical protein